MEKEEKLDALRKEVYFFILKKVKRESRAKDVFQNTYLKAHEKHHTLRDKYKVRGWLYQIARHEIADYFNRESYYVSKFDNAKNRDVTKEPDNMGAGEFCCFNKFIDELPGIYRAVFELIFLNGKTQKEAASLLNISLPNVKARVRRGKAILKQRFNECCRYQIDEKGNLIGNSDCPRCNAVLDINKEGN